MAIKTIEEANGYVDILNKVGFNIQHFQLAGSPQLQSDAQGDISRYPQRNLDPSVPLTGNFKTNNAYMNFNNIDNDTGFCKFIIPGVPAQPGVYIWVAVDGSKKEIVYIGETEKLSGRINRDYGNIGTSSVMKVHGQRTNVKMNHFVHDWYKAGKTLELYYVITDRHKLLEAFLLDGTPSRDLPPLNRVF